VTLKFRAVEALNNKRIN